MSPELRLLILTYLAALITVIGCVILFGLVFGGYL